MLGFSPWLQSLCIIIFQNLVTVCSFCSVAPEENCTKSLGFFNNVRSFYCVVQVSMYQKNLFKYPWVCMWSIIITFGEMGWSQVKPITPGNKLWIYRDSRLHLDRIEMQLTCRLGPCRTDDRGGKVQLGPRARCSRAGWTCTWDDGEKSSDQWYDYAKTGVNTPSMLNPMMQKTRIAHEVFCAQLKVWRLVSIFRRSRSPMMNIWIYLNHWLYLSQ